MVGRDPTCDIVLDSDAISSRHALISCHDNLHTLHDIGSFNGTMVNGERVKTRALVHQDIIMVADTMLIFDAYMIRGSASQPITVVKMPQATLKTAAVVPQHLYRQPIATVERMSLLNQAQPQVQKAAGIQQRVQTPRPSADAMLNMMIEKEKKRLEFAVVLGWWSIVAFPLTIVMAHLSHTRNERDAKRRMTALALGYGALVLWVCAYFLFREDPNLVLERESLAAAKAATPTVVNSDRYVNGPMAWVPHGLEYTGLAEAYSSKFFDIGSEPKGSALRSEYLNTWKSGTIIVGVKPTNYHLVAEARSLRITLEDYTHTPDGQGFNTLMVPSRRYWVKGFYLPSFDKNLTVEGDTNLVIQRDAGGKPLPWSQQAQILDVFAAGDIPAAALDQRDLRLLLLVAPGGAEPVPVTLNTKESNASNKVTKKHYTVPVIPSGLVGYILYIEGQRRPLQTQIVNFTGTAQTANEMLDKILNMKPTADELPKVFRLSEVKTLTAEPAAPPVIQIPIVSEPTQIPLPPIPTIP